MATERVRRAVGGDFSNKAIALLGLSFKPETDDMRDSPVIPLVTALLKEGATVRAFDPEAMENARTILPEGIEYCSDSYDAAADADALVIVTEWNQFRSLDLERINKEMKGNVVVDLRNVYDAKKMAENGFDYSSVGRAAEDLPEF